MKLEVWMIVAAGVALAVGIGAITVLLLGLHAQVRKLSRTAEGLQKVLAANLRQMMPQAALPRREAVPVIERPAVRVDERPARPPVVAEPATESLVELAAAAVASVAAPPAPLALPDPHPTLAAQPARSAHPQEPRWNPDRRLLVVRLASRGKKPDQIAAALRIPEEEIERFLESNRLLTR